MFAKKSAITKKMLNRPPLMRRRVYTFQCCRPAVIYFTLWDSGFGGQKVVRRYENIHESDETLT
jgi:hypothetical protein